jgi:iron complex outermembrane recepter protein
MVLTKSLVAGTATCALAIFLSAPDVRAQTSAGAGASTIEEVVVTARKREESLQSIPVAVTSVSGNQIERQGIRQTSDLTKIVPSLTVAPSSSASTAAVFSLRGQAAGDILLTLSQPVGIYEDTVNIPHADGLQGAFFDVGRVEVLKGPQGTLYGRNTTGGAVNIVTRNADYDGLHGFVMGEYGNFKDWKVGGAVNLPIMQDMLSARLAYQHWNRDGFGKSRTTGIRVGSPHDDDVARLSIKFDPATYLTSNTKLEYVHLDQTGYLTKLVALPPGSPAALEAGLESGCGSFANIAGLATCGTAALNAFVNDRDIFRNSTNGNVQANVKTWHAVEDLTWDISDDVKLRSITGYHHVLDFQNLDLDGSPFQLLEVGAGAGGGVQPIAPFSAYPYRRTPENKYSSYTQEFNLSGNAFDRLDWLVGAYGSWEDGRGGEPFIAFADLSQGAVNNTTSSIGEKTRTWAIFTQNDLKFSDKVSVTLGARYTEERQTNRARFFNFSGGQFSCAPVTTPATTPFGAPGNDPDHCPDSASTGSPTSEKASGTSYLASFNYQVTPETLIYVKTARGFRGGALQFRAPQFAPVKPEIAVDYEVGFKSDFFDHRLRTNLAAYQTNYTNKQELIIILLNGATTTQLFNAATARIRGFEAEVTAVPVEGLSVYGTLTYLDGSYLNFPAALTPEGATFNASGLSFADPNWRYNVGGRYERDLGPGRLGGQLDWSWRDKTNLTRLNTDVLFPIDLIKKVNGPVGLLNARLDYNLPNNGVTVALFATNLLNKHYQTFSLFSGALGIATAQTEEPRMFGVSVRKSFGNE